MTLVGPVPDCDVEELRIALALNGGVSLAIWIGGVTTEVKRLVDAEGPYGDALALLRSTARVDVISGSSAGGLNGAFLALALVHRTSLSVLRDVWTESARLESLFRDPLASSMPSLMRGDDYFLPELHQAMQRLWEPDRKRHASVDEVPIDLTITTTLLQGLPNQRPDDFGSVVIDTNHRGEFRFRRGRDPDIERDDFTHPLTVAQLALAARCTASFPAAFEPSFCPIGENGPDGLHPDMKDVADFNVSRYVVDGGVLVNKPLSQALEAIFAQRADRQVRRVLAYVVPAPGLASALTPDEMTSPPTVAEVVVDSVVTLPRAESIARELEEIRAHNRAVQHRRNARDALIVGLGRGVVGLAERLFSVYRSVRRDSSVRYIVDRLVTRVASAEHELSLEPNTLRWDHDQLRRSLLDTQLPLPWIPANEPDWVGPVERWQWGLFPIERVATIALDIIRRTTLRARFDSEERVGLGRLSGTLHDLLATLRQLRNEDDLMGKVVPPNERFLQLLDSHRNDAPGLNRAVTAEIVTRLATWRTDRLEDAGAAALLGGLALCVVELIRQTCAQTRAVLDGRNVAPAVEPTGGPPDEAVLWAWVHAVDGLDEQSLLKLVLAFEVIETSLGATAIGADQLVELVQISSEVATPYDPSRTRADVKLAGIQLGHFGAFVKCSWRANDWLWGRLDGSTKLAQIVLSPARLRQLYPPRPGGGYNEELGGEGTPGPFEELLLGPPHSADRDFLRSLLDGDEVAIGAELAFLRDGMCPTPSSMPSTVAALARRIQLDVLRDELPAIAAAVQRDREEGASLTSRASGFLRAWNAATSARQRDVSELSPKELVDLFVRCDIGRETLNDELGSDLLTRTASVALADVVSVAYDKRSGIRILRSAARSVRAVVLVLWLIVRNATSSSGPGPAINAAALGAGAALVAVSVFTDVNFPVWLANAAWVLVIAAVLVALLRTVTLLVLAVMVATVGWSAWVVLGHHPAPFVGDENPAAGAVAIVAFVGLVLVIGSVRQPVHLGRAYAELRRVGYGFVGTDLYELNAAALLKSHRRRDLVWLSIGTAGFVALANTLAVVRARSLVSIVAEVLAATALVAVAAKVSGASRWSLGFGSKQLGKHLIGALVAAAVVGGAIGLLWGLTDVFDRQTQLLPRSVGIGDLVSVVLATAVAREVVFRGVLLGGWARLLGPLNALALTSVTFGMASYAAEYHRLQHVPAPAGGWELALEPLIGVGMLAILGIAVLGPMRLLGRGLIAPILVEATAGVTTVLAVAPTVRLSW